MSEIPPHAGPMRSRQTPARSTRRSVRQRVQIAHDFGHHGSVVRIGREDSGLGGDARASRRSAGRPGERRADRFRFGPPSGGKDAQRPFARPVQADDDGPRVHVVMVEGGRPAREPVTRPGQSGFRSNHRPGCERHALTSGLRAHHPWATGARPARKPATPSSPMPSATASAVALLNATGASVRRRSQRARSRRMPPPVWPLRPRTRPSAALDQPATRSSRPRPRRTRRPPNANPLGSQVSDGSTFSSRPSLPRGMRFSPLWPKRYAFLAAVAEKGMHFFPAAAERTRCWRPRAHGGRGLWI
jgi:hypothetical protein